MKKQTHLSIPPLLFPCPTPFLLKQLLLRLSMPSIPMTSSNACGQPSLPPPAAAAVAMAAASLDDPTNV